MIYKKDCQHLRYINFYCYFNMYILAVNDIQSRTPGLYTIKFNNKIVYVVDIRLT